MHNRSRILLTCALFASLISAIAFQPRSSYADGDVHIIIVRSTTDPALTKANQIWFERLENALGNKEYDQVYDSFKVFGALEPAKSLGGLSKNDVKTYKTLEGQEALPENIMKVCREVSEEAGENDAIVVFISSHGVTNKGTDNVSRQGFAPVAPSKANLDILKKGIQRKTILDCLSEKPHRLIVLLSDSCASPSAEEPAPGAAPVAEQATQKGQVPYPKDTPYFKMFLQKAHGVVNINSVDNGQAAMYYSKSLDASSLGTLFINAFYRFATNGFYLESELNPTDFYRLLRIEQARQAISFMRMTGVNRVTQEILTQYDGSVSNGQNPYPFEKMEEIAQYDKDRAEKLKNSGEFTIGERTFVKTSFSSVPGK